MSPDTEPTKGHSRYRNCYWTPEDQRNFTHILKEAFPGLVITTLDVANEKFNYFDTIADVDNSSFIFLPEPGWAPKFGIADPADFPNSKSLLNTPRRCIGVYRTEILEQDLSKRGPDPQSRAKPPDCHVSYFAGYGHIQSYYHDGRPDEKSFVAKLFRLMTKFMTNSVEVIDLHTREVVEIDHGSILWSGPDVVRRCRDDEDFFIYFDCPEYLDHRWVGAKAIPKPPRAKKNTKLQSN